MENFITMDVTTWRATSIEGNCQYSQENLDKMLEKVKELLTEYSGSSVNIRRINDSLILKFVS